MAHTPVRVIEDVYLLNKNTPPSAIPVLIAVLFQETKKSQEKVATAYITLFLEIVGS